MNIFNCFFLFQTKKFIASIYANIMLNKFPLLKMYHSCFFACVKAALFVVPLIVFGKWKAFAGLQIRRKKI